MLPSTLTPPPSLYQHPIGRVTRHLPSAGSGPGPRTCASNCWRQLLSSDLGTKNGRKHKYFPAFYYIYVQPSYHVLRYNLWPYPNLSFLGSKYLQRRSLLHRRYVIPKKICLNIHEYHVSCVISLHLPACLVLQNIKSVRMIKMTRTPIIAPIMGASASSVRATQYGAGREEKSSPENYPDHFLFALSQDYFS